MGAIQRARRLGGYYWTWTAPFPEDQEHWSFDHARETGLIGPGEWAAPPHALIDVANVTHSSAPQQQ